MDAEQEYNLRLRKSLERFVPRIAGITPLFPVLVLMKKNDAGAYLHSDLILHKQTQQQYKTQGTPVSAMARLESIGVAYSVNAPGGSQVWFVHSERYNQLLRFFATGDGFGFHHKDAVLARFGLFSARCKVSLSRKLRRPAEADRWSLTGEGLTTSSISAWCREGVLQKRLDLSEPGSMVNTKRSYWFFTPKWQAIMLAYSEMEKAVGVWKKNPHLEPTTVA